MGRARSHLLCGLEIDLQHDVVGQQTLVSTAICMMSRALLVYKCLECETNASFLSDMKT